MSYPHEPHSWPTALSVATSTDRPVVLVGPPGAGKFEAAIAIHNGSPRRSGPLYRLPCHGFPDTLLASELVGHQVGGFPGAFRNREGGVWRAHQGTLILSGVDRIGDRTLDRLKRLTHTGEVLPLGGSVSSGNVDARLVITTEADVIAAVLREAFGPDGLLEIRVPHRS